MECLQCTKLIFGSVSLVNTINDSIEYLDEERTNILESGLIRLNCSLLRLTENLLDIPILEHENV